MKSPEPVTALTDYLLAAVYLAFALPLFSRGYSQRQVSLQLAGFTFFSTVLGSVAGGTYHLIGGEILWKATIYCIGLAGFLMVASAAFVTTVGSLRRILLIGAALQFVAFGTWVITHDDFRYVIYDYGAAMLLTLVLFCSASYRRLSRNTPWIGASVLLTLAGSAFQASDFDLHRNFNHNDAYHIIQIGAGWLLYRGFRNSTDRIPKQPFRIK
jgi:uncharacterized protein DUF6962